MTQPSTPAPVPAPLRVMGGAALHPLLFAVHPALALWAANVTEATPGEVWPAMWIPALICLGAWTVLALGAWSIRRGALVSSAVMVTALNAGAADLRLTLVVGIMACWIIGVATIVIRWLRGTALLATTALVNVIAVVMVLQPLSTVLGQWGPGASAQIATTEVEGGLAGRDIWYIIPDRYPRLDTLAEQYEFDNQPFISHLEDIGFQVADHALANYPKTAHSLAATWNMAPLDELVPVPPEDEGDWQPLYQLLKDNLLGRTLTESGYEYTHLGTWWGPTAHAASADREIRADDHSEFVAVYRTQTMLPAEGEDDDGGGLREVNRHYTSYQLDQLDRLATEPHDAPHLVVAHITLPHGPYVFEPDGSLVTEEEEDARSEDENFLNHLRYLNTRLRALVDQLTSGPESTWPVIVIQSDEGPNPPARQGFKNFDYTTASIDELQRKLATLSAILLPDSDVVVPEDLTGINTWRLILDAVIGTDLGMVEDPVKVFPDEDHLYTLVDVGDRVR